MEVPLRNVEGLWEAVDTTNDSWAYAWYDENWKTPKEILRRLISSVARGGTYMLNIGPRADGTICPEQTALLEQLGRWTAKHAEAVYGTRPRVSAPIRRALVGTIMLVKPSPN